MGVLNWVKVWTDNNGDGNHDEEALQLGRRIDAQKEEGGDEDHLLCELFYSQIPKA
jgi:hypothetical protein